MSQAAVIQRGKILLVVGLAAVLLFVLFGDTKDGGSVAPAISLVSPDELPPEGMLAGSEGMSLRAAWPAVDLEILKSRCPFDPLPIAAPEPPVPSEPLVAAPEPDEEAQTAEIAPPPPAPITVKVRAIYEQANERVALVDQKVVRVGDLIAGARVIAITADEVVLERQ